MRREKGEERERADRMRKKEKRGIGRERERLGGKRKGGEKEKVSKERD